MTNQEICNHLAELAMDEQPSDSRVMALIRGMNRLAMAHDVLRRQLQELIDEAGGQP